MSLLLFWSKHCNLKRPFCVSHSGCIFLILVSCHTSFGLYLLLLFASYFCPFVSVSSLQSFSHLHDAFGCNALKTLMLLMLYRLYTLDFLTTFRRFLCRLVYRINALCFVYMFYLSIYLHRNRHCVKRNFVNLIDVFSNVWGGVCRSVFDL